MIALHVVMKLFATEYFRIFLGCCSLRSENFAAASVGQFLSA